MKLTRIKLKNYYQFEDVEIDLTYPKGHAKVGTPLDKVCFLGHSGTGKTTLLRLIKWFVSLKRDIGKDILLPLHPVPRSIEMDFRFLDLEYRMFNQKPDPYRNLNWEWSTGMSTETFHKILEENYRIVKPVLINFPTELLWGQNPPPVESTDPVDELLKIKSREKGTDLLENPSIIDFAVEDMSKHWEYILDTIRSHRTRELLIKKKLADTALKKGTSTSQKKELKKQADEYNKWLEENPSPLDSLSDECLDPLLFHMGLKVKRDIDETSIQNLGFIALQTINGQDVPFDFWSTGTRQFLQTVIPLFQLKPKDAVILVDEPERSLYPDIQRRIIDTYVKMAPDSQFFFATHSPIITSAFEPWEIVELKFDKEHKSVYRELYYNGDNHVDNYKYFPEYMRWDSILQRIFDLEDEGSDKRIEALEELTEKRAQIEKLKKIDKLDSGEGKKLVKRFHDLSKILGYTTRTENHETH
ncbi:MAG TPA: AAA family ATPase [Candidatus Deferrimicrobium sp.]|nr:AAA family ATPase [Candidatus Deferrimicrobium sp.]